MPNDHDDDSRLYWWRFLWNRYALLFAFIRMIIGGMYAVRQARLANNVDAIGGYFKQADAIDP